MGNKSKLLGGFVRDSPQVRAIIRRHQLKVLAKRRQTPVGVQILGDMWDQSSTATELIESFYDDRPVPSGVLDDEGNMIFRYFHRDRVRFGFQMPQNAYEDEDEDEEDEDEDEDEDEPFLEDDEED